MVGLKSQNSRTLLCKDVLLQPDFNPRDLVGINFNALDKKLEDIAKTWDPVCPLSEGWRSVDIQLQIPPPHPTQLQSMINHHVKIPGLRCQRLVDIMRRAFSINDVPTFHYEPFEAYWIPPGSPSGAAQRLSDEMYSAPTMIQAHQEVQKLKISDSECTLPRCVAAFMLSSDALQFGSFCNVKGWPIYAYFGNESKYERCKPSSNTCFVIAHVPVVSPQVSGHILLKYKPDLLCEVTG